MNTTLQYALNNGEQDVTITLANKNHANDYKISKGGLCLGDMKFEQDYWIYNGMSDFTRDELIAIADFIKVNYPANNNN